jgi:hypothetical protein
LKEEQPFDVGKLVRFVIANLHSILQIATFFWVIEFIIKAYGLGLTIGARL